VLVVQDDQSPLKVEEDNEAKEVPNPTEKPINSEPKSLFIDGYRAST